MRDFHLPGRSAVYAASAMVATSMPQASLAAIDMLKAGGNALDAAVAAAAVLAVVEPQSTGIGGDCFCLYKPNGKPVAAFNGSGRAPAGAHIGALHSAGVTKWEDTSPHAVTIPGAVAAWEMLLKAHGRKSMDQVLNAAIGFAEHGYVVAPRVAHDWAASEAKLRKTGAAGLLVDGAAPRTGTIMRHPGLAASLRKIAANGAKAFYEGEMAAAMVAALTARGGFHTEADFAAGLGAGLFVDPISAKFTGHDVWECPPNGSGVIALMIMGIMNGFAPKGDPLDPLRVHRHIEAARLVYRDRDAFLADPAQVDVPVAHLLSDEYLAGLRALIDDDRAMASLPEAGHAHRDTVYISVVDRDGNACSFINSLFDSFGSGIIAGDTGIVLHNRGLGFSLTPGHPNCIAPHKRPMHTIIPAMTTRNGQAEIVFGVMGGHYQPMGQSFVLGNMLQYGLDPQAAVDLPRYFPWAGQVELERGIPPATRAGLAARGHAVNTLDKSHGGAQAIVINHAAGVLIGGSDPRKDGCALGY
ncbi:MAG: gamma-glutamyltransferase family protein [Acidocella sp.]|nr:gamma-glutamyltransferase family protein [Acidocella sp.]